MTFILQENGVGPLRSIPNAANLKPDAAPTIPLLWFPNSVNQLDSARNNQIVPLLNFYNVNPNGTIAQRRRKLNTLLRG